MNKAERMVIIKRHIAIMSDDEQHAHEIIQGLLQENWSEIIPIIHSHSPDREKYKKLPCVHCKKIFDCGVAPSSGLCGECSPKLYHKAAALINNLNRAKIAGVPHTLTFRSWRETVDDFNGKCAYCVECDNDNIEHFIPISLGGGTTKSNCVPTCPSCNSKKGNRHPDTVKRFFPDGTIERIRAYLKRFQEK